MQGWLGGICDRERYKLHHARQTPRALYPSVSVAESISVMDKAVMVCKAIYDQSSMQTNSKPTLWHNDLHMGNIFISPELDNISCIIDWQFASISPAIRQVDWPSFLEPPEDYDYGLVAPSLPANFDELDDFEQALAKHHLHQCAAAKVYEGTFFRQDRRVYDILHAHSVLREILIRLEESFDEGVVPLRHCLIEMSQSWSQLGLSGACPVMFTEEEVTTHAAQFEQYSEWHRIGAIVRKYLDTDFEGWIPPSVDPKERHQRNKQLFELCVENEANNFSRAELLSIWPIRLESTPT